MDWKYELSKITDNVLFDEEMKAHTSFRIGGAAEAFVTAASSEEAARVIRFCRDNDVKLTIMGNGSNMLVSDEGIKGVVLRIAAPMTDVKIEGTTVTAKCGVLLSALASKALEAELSGLEFASGIPGTLGGGVFMNAGAYGGEMKDVIVSVNYLDENGNLCTAYQDELDLSYRHSMFSKRKCVILSCVMELEKGNYETIKEKMADYSQRRRDKQPLNMPSAGSTFKRPEGYFAGKLIQDAGLSGYSVGGAQVSEKHAGFVVNTGDATAKDVCDLIAHIQKTVMEKFGVMLEPEVRVID